MAPAYLTVRDLVTRWRMSRASVYRLIKAGYLPKPVRFASRTVRWSLRDVEAFEQKLDLDRGTAGAAP